MLSISNIIAIALGGAIGAVFRAYSIHLTNKYIPLEFPLGVLGVNVIGSFLIGLAFAYFASFNVPDTYKAFFTTGFLGALTTYSTFAIETYLLFGTSLYLALANIILNVSGSIFAAAFGYKLFSLFLR